MPPAKTYSISELAKHFDVTPRAIRFYEDQGLLSPKRVNGQRVYNDGDFVRLKLILRGKRIGFSLAELKQTIALYDTQPDSKVQLQYVLNTIEVHRQDLIERKEDIETTLADMDDVQARITDQMELL
ncbi:MAG: MerR family transcriptional regulator [Gammaproteobacteria bacterium]|nr:MAG: MerR family transcriptional regulator [Gammaproteobacteria bacterium]